MYINLTSKATRQLQELVKETTVTEVVHRAIDPLYFVDNVGPDKQITIRKDSRGGPRDDMTV